MIRIVLALLIVTIPVSSFAQSFRAKSGYALPGKVPSLTLCIYGDSIVDDDSPSGNQTTGSESKGVCDWCDPLVDAGFTIVSMGMNGARAWDTDDPSVVDLCASHDNCPTSGEQAALVDDTGCPGTGRSTSCRDVIGDTTLDSTYMDDIAPFCDVFAFFYGTNDTANAESGTDFEAVHQAVIEKAASLDKPVVFWEAPPSYLQQRRYDRLADYRSAVASSVAAVTASERGYVSVFSAWDLWQDFRNQYGWVEQRKLYGDNEECEEEWSQSAWDEYTSNQTGDCTHPNRFVVNANLGMIPADWMGKAIMNHVLGVASSFSAGKGGSISTPEDVVPSNLWGSGVWGEFIWGP